MTNSSDSDSDANPAVDPGPDSVTTAATLAAGSPAPGEGAGTDGVEAMDPQSTARLLEELRIHQLELEMQNEELRRVQAELDRSREHFAELYNRAPVGYVTIDVQARIRQCNDTFCRMLGTQNYQVTGRLLRNYIHAEDAPVFDARFRAFHKRPENKHIDLRLRGEDDYFPARLQARRVDDGPVRSRASDTDAPLLVAVSDITELKRIEDRNRHLAVHDSLTDLPNRRYLKEQLERALANNHRHNRLGGLLFIDLDNFKAVNDSLGHAAGDHMLRQVASRLNSRIRQEDVLARMGGDEFVVLLADRMADSERLSAHARMVAEKLLDELRQPFDLEGRTVYTGASIGIALFPTQPGDAVDDILRMADTAMYRAKATGRDRARFFEQSMQSSADRELHLASDLRNAAAGDQFRMLYQPVVDKRGRIVSAEALLRWRHPDMGTVDPDDFIPVAEDSGLIGPVGLWVVERVLQDLRRLRSHLDQAPRFRFGINVSGRQLELGQFAGEVQRLAGQYDVSPGDLIVEITESLLLPEGGVTAEQLQRLVDMGITLSLDDFGTGFSSLAAIRRNPIGQVKIDRSFIAELDSNDESGVLVDTIILLGHRLGLSVVAEGVETETQADFLRIHGCDLMQGFRFHQPMDFERLLEALTNQGPVR